MKAAHSPTGMGFSFFVSKVQIFGSFIRAALIFVAIVYFVSGVVEAAGTPRTLSYQGILTDDAGVVVPDGSYSLTFRIYDVESGGTELWKEDHGSVQVQKGIFNVILGSVNSLDLDFDVPYWLGISVEGEKELEPRIPLVSSPYSMNAVRVKGANVFPASGNVGIRTTTPLEALDVNGGVRIGNTGSTNAGTIRWTGTDFEGYDGSGWKSLTDTGGGSLPPGSAGQTLRHDGSSWIAASSLYNNGTNVGIGTTAPQSKFHVRQDSDGATGIIIENRDTGSNSVEELIFANEDGSLAGVRLYDDGGAYPSRMRIFNSRPNAALLLTNDVGSIEIDSVGATAINSNGGIYKFRGAEFKALRGSSDTPFMRFYGGSNGGIFSLYDEKGNNLGSIEADLDGEGGWMGVASDENYNNGIYLDGNYWGSLEPVLTIDGSSRSVVFDMGQSGNLSVQLPNNAIGAYEILDEPGAASNATSDYTEIALSSGWNTLMTVTINPPAVGYVLVIGSCQVRMDHPDCSGTGGTLAHFGVSNQSDPANHQINQRLSLEVPCGLPASEYYLYPVTVHGLFWSYVSNTYYFRGYNVSGHIYVSKIQLTAIFIPTAYGSIVTASNIGDSNTGRGMVRQPMAEVEIAREKQLSESANQDRIEREIEEMQKRLDEIKADLKRRKEKQYNMNIQ